MTDVAAERLDSDPRWTRTHWRMTARVLIAGVGCYAMAAAVAMALARALPMERIEAAATATIFGMVLWPSSVVAVFAFNNVTRIAVVIGGVTALSAALAWALGQPS